MIEVTVTHDMWRMQRGFSTLSSRLQDWVIRETISDAAQRGASRGRTLVRQVTGGPIQNRKGHIKHKRASAGSMEAKIESRSWPYSATYKGVSGGQGGISFVPWIARRLSGRARPKRSLFDSTPVLYRRGRRRIYYGPSIARELERLWLGRDYGADLPDFVHDRMMGRAAALTQLAIARALGRTL